MSEAYGDIMDPIVAKQLRNALDGTIEKRIEVAPEKNTDPPMFCDKTDTEKYMQDDIVKGVQLESAGQVSDENNIDFAKSLDGGEILISTVNCGIICKPKNIGLEDNFIVLFLDSEETKK